jgi:DNA (cytosine-5)-methyltransferase 1
VAARPTAVDLFAGAGGTTQGLREAGFDVIGAIENDPSACSTFRANHMPGCRLEENDIAIVDPTEFAAGLRLRGRRLDLLTACPPCQPFSTLGSGDPDDPRNDLVGVVGDFVDALRPRVVLIENVPGLAAQPTLQKLLERLAERYDIALHLVQASDFGVPQSRKRMIVLAIDKTISPTVASAELTDRLPETFDCSAHTAGDALGAIGDLTSDVDSVHRARRSQPLTVKRLRATTQGGGRRELPDDLVLDCHRDLEGTQATSIYGRIDPTRPAPTMTTRCTTPSCGRFGHPTEDRGLTLREAALLQTFPLTYRFEGNYGEIERQIGNAVPPRLAQALGLIVIRALAAKSSAKRHQMTA